MVRRRSVGDRRPAEVSLNLILFTLTFLRLAFNLPPHLLARGSPPFLPDAWWTNLQQFVQQINLLAGAGWAYRSSLRQTTAGLQLFSDLLHRDCERLDLACPFSFPFRCSLSSGFAGMT